MRQDLVDAGTDSGNGLGREARTPLHIPLRGWKAVVLRAFREMASDRISLSAAGCAFYATLALFPAISMLISLYGLVFNPDTVAPQLQVIRRFLPAAAYQLIFDRINTLVTKPAQTLSIGLVVSTALAFWSASSGTKSMLWSLNIAYEETEKRGVVRFYATTFALTLMTVFGVILAVTALVLLPVVIGFLGLSQVSKGFIKALGFLVVVAFVSVGLSVLYRFGPSRRGAAWHWITPGSAVATVLWLLGSALFSVYVGDVANYSDTYGPIGAVVAVMMWFYVSVYVVLMGAELNAELELQTSHDTTGRAQPMGSRGAFVADHVAR
jgi:membrane protein